ncbi:addiction module protein [Puia dinghuensis]|nr:addiction module protein [Puia dinghuensis]
MNPDKSASTRHKLYDYIRLADDKKLNAIYSLLEGEIEEASEWWKDKGFVDELDRRYKALESGSDEGFTVEELKASIGKLRIKRYGK